MMRCGTKEGKRKGVRSHQVTVGLAAVLPLRKDLRGADNFPSINRALAPGNNPPTRTG